MKLCTCILKLEAFTEENVIKVKLNHWYIFNKVSSHINMYVIKTQIIVELKT